MLYNGTSMLAVAGMHATPQTIGRTTGAYLPGPVPFSTRPMDIQLLGLGSEYAGSGAIAGSRFVAPPRLGGRYR